MLRSPASSKPSSQQQHLWAPCWPLCSIGQHTTPLPVPNLDWLSRRLRPLLCQIHPPTATNLHLPRYRGEDWCHPISPYLLARNRILHILQWGRQELCQVGHALACPTPLISTMRLSSKSIEYLVEVFSKRQAIQVSPYYPYNLAIDLLPGSSPPCGCVFSLSGPESYRGICLPLWHCLVFFIPGGHGVLFLLSITSSSCGSLLIFSLHPVLQFGFRTYKVIILDRGSQSITRQHTAFSKWLSTALPLTACYIVFHSIHTV